MMTKRVYGQLILFMCVLLFLTSSSVATDEEVLLAFKQSIQDPLGVLSDWNSSSNSVQICNWTGVTCDNQTLRVTNLTLRSSELGGSISPAIGGLTELTNLDLSDNNLEGSIPDSLGNCTKLVNLSLTYNFLNGAIPASAFGNLRQLQNLLLSNNNLTSTIPSALGNCLQLRFLDLSVNKLEGSIPASLGNCTKLVSLTLSNNALIGSIPSSFGNLLQLQGLLINSNSLTGGFPIEIFLAMNKTLSELGLSENQLTGSLPDKFDKFQALSQLDLSSNNFTGPIPNTVGRSGRLTVLNLAYNRFTGPLPLSIGSLQPTFQISFNVSHNLLNGSLVPLTNLVYTVSVDVSRNELTGNIPANVTRCIYLTNVDLSQNLLTGEVPPGLATLKLHHLNVSNNNLTGSIDEFTNVTASSFLPGNDGLCGRILNRTCPGPEPGPAPGIPPGTKRAPAELSRKQRTIVLFSVSTLVFGFLVIFASWFDGVRVKSTRHLRDAVTCYGRGHGMVRLTVKDVIVATDGFNERNVIGSGGTSTVYKGLLPFYPFIIAVKKFRDDEDGRQRLLKEAGIMSSVRHRNIVGTLGLASIPRSVNVLVLEYVANRTLNHHLHGNSEVCEIGWEVRLNIAIDVATAVSYLHEDTDQHLAVIHGDLKPANIFLDTDFSAKVGDFGLSKLLVDVCGVNRDERRWEGTFGYSPPEHGEGLICTAGDVYSFGVVILEMATRRRPASLAFEDLGGSFINWVQAAFPDRLIEIVDPSLKLEEDFSSKKGAIDLFIRIGLLCTNKDPRKRPTMREALEMIKTLVVNSTTETAPTLGRTMEELISESSNTSFQHAKTWGWVNKDFIFDTPDAHYYDSWVSIFRLDLRDSRTLKAMGFDTEAVKNIRKQTHQRRAIQDKAAKTSWIRTIWRALYLRAPSRRIHVAN